MDPPPRAVLLFGRLIHSQHQFPRTSCAPYHISMPRQLLPVSLTRGSLDLICDPKSFISKFKKKKEKKKEENWLRPVRKEKKNPQFIFMCFACILFFIYLCLQYSKKKKKALTNKGKKKKNSNFEFQNSKIQKKNVG